MNRIEWNDKQGNRDRDAWLILIREEDIVFFKGENIQKICVVIGSDKGESSNTYRIALAEGVKTIAGKNGWETGTFLEGLGKATAHPTPDTWAEVAKCFGTSVPAAMRFLREWKPKEAYSLDETERALEALEASEDNTDVERVVVSFGSPTNRQIREGWWNAPKEISGYEAEIRLIDPEDREGDWSIDNIEVVGTTGKVISVAYEKGARGGYYSVIVEVTLGTEI